MAQPYYQPQSKKYKKKRKKNKKYNQHHQQQQEFQSQSHSSNNQLLLIDGSLMEGGGQILRNSTAFAALMKTPIHITNIRGKRSTPGLRKQHSKGIELACKINGGFVENNFVKSMDIKFYPSTNPSYISHYKSNIETAGSVCLLMQTCLPLLLFNPMQCVLECIGGTNASFAPQIDYYQLVFAPMLQRLMGINIDIRCSQRGFFPRGGGKILLRTEPIETTIPCFDLTKRGNVSKIYGNVIIAGRDMALSIGNEVIKGALRELQIKFGKNVNIKLNVLPKCKIDSFSNGIGIVIALETNTGCVFGGSALNNGKKLSHKEIGRIAARELICDWESTKNGCCDRWLQDQLIIFMALAKGKSRMMTCALELHTESAIYIAEKLTGVKFEVSNMKDGTVLIECEGIGYCVGMKGKDKIEQKEKEENNAKSKNLLTDRPGLF